MNAVEVGLEPLFVAAATRLHLVICEDWRRWISDRQHRVQVLTVARAAIERDRSLHVAACHRAPVHVIAQCGLLLLVTDTAGLRQMRWMNGGIRVLGGAHRVFRVAGDACHGLLGRRLLEVHPMRTLPKLCHGICLRVGLKTPHRLHVRVAMSAEAGKIRGSFYCPKPVFLRMRCAKVRRLSVSPMAILAADAFLPVNVVLQIVRRDEEVLGLLLPHVRVAVASHTEIVFEGLFSFCRPTRGRSGDKQQHGTKNSYHALDSSACLLATA
jgi:hypothetical protein